MAWPERQLLGRWTYSVATLGNLGAGASWTPTPVQVNSPNLPQGLLNGNQVGEVESIVVYSPVNMVTGASDDLKYIQLSLDGQQYPYVWVSGRNDSNMVPPFSRIRSGPKGSGTYLSLGAPTYGLNGTIASPLDATCPKFITSATPVAWAGTTAVTHDFTIDLWGYVYNSTQLAGLMPTYYVPNNTVQVNDPRNGRIFTFPYLPVAASTDWRGAWTSLPGGISQNNAQALPVNKFVRTSLNKNASTINMAYQPSYTNSAVANPQDNLFFTLNAKQAILVQAYGVNGPTAPNSTGYDLNSAWIAVPNQAPQQAPAGGIPAAFNLSDVHFGLTAGQTYEYHGVPFLPEGPQLLWNEQAYLTWVDNGTSIPAGNVRQEMVAILIGSNAQGV